MERRVWVYENYSWMNSQGIKKIEGAKPLSNPIFAIYADGRELITLSKEEALTFYKSGKTDSIWKACRSRRKAEIFLAKIRTLLR